MVRVAMHSLPWGRLAAAAVLLGILMEGISRWPWSMWPLQGIAVGLLAAAVGWCLDEPAGAVVDAAPRPLWWRTVARLPGITALILMWSVAVWSARHHLFGHPWDVWTQGLTCSAVAVAWATWRRSMGVPTPGIAFAAVLVPAAALWALMRPFAATFPVFPYAAGGWSTSTPGWIGVGFGAVVSVALVLSDVHWLRLGRLADRQRLPADREFQP